MGEGEENLFVELSETYTVIHWDVFIQVGFWQKGVTPASSCLTACSKASIGLTPLGNLSFLGCGSREPSKTKHDVGRETVNRWYACAHKC